MCENTGFLRGLSELLPTLQRIISANPDLSPESRHHDELSNIVNDVRETNLQIYRVVLKMQTTLPLQSRATTTSLFPGCLRLPRTIPSRVHQQLGGIYSSAEHQV